MSSDDARLPVCTHEGLDEWTLITKRDPSSEVKCSSGERPELLIASITDADSASSNEDEADTSAFAASCHISPHDGQRPTETQYHAISVVCNELQKIISATASLPATCQAGLNALRTSKMHLLGEMMRLTNGYLTDAPSMSEPDDDQASLASDDSSNDPEPLNEYFEHARQRNLTIEQLCDLELDSAASRSITTTTTDSDTDNFAIELARQRKINDLHAKLTSKEKDVEYQRCLCHSLNIDPEQVRFRRPHRSRADVFDADISGSRTPASELEHRGGSEAVLTWLTTPRGAHEKDIVE